YAIHAQSAGTVSTLPDNIVTNGAIAAGQVVKSLNGLTDSVSLSAGANVNLTPNGNSIQISATGGGIWRLNSASAFYNNGNVGIGTTTPSTGLQVYGIGTAELGLESKFSDFGDPRTALWTLQSSAHLGVGLPPRPVVGQFKIIDRNAGQSRLSIDEFGEVGIGTTNPVGMLDVQGDVSVGTGLNNERHKLTIRGPNSPVGGASATDLSFEFPVAGSAKVRASRGSSWDTSLEFLTTD